MENKIMEEQLLKLPEAVMSKQLEIMSCADVNGT